MKLQFIAAAVIAACALPAQASLINSAGSLLNPTSVLDFESYDGLITAGPEVVSTGVTFSGDVDAELGATIRDLSENGIWGVGNHFAAAGSNGQITFTFDSLQSGVGAFVNHFRDISGSVTVSAYDSSSALLETYSLALSTDVYSYNDSAFLGISRNVADIRSVTFSGVGAVADNLTYTTAVPEPTSYLLAICGLGLLAGVAHRRKKSG